MEYNIIYNKLYSFKNINEKVLIDDSTMENL
jgi:hypothetical protein